MQKFKEPEAEVELELSIVSLTRSFAVAKRPHDQSVVENFAVTRGHLNLHHSIRNV